MRFDVYDRYENYLFSLGDADLITTTWDGDLLGTDTLMIVTAKVLEKDQRLVWRDRRGKHHEHIVDSSQGYEEIGEQYTCLNSLVETYGTHIEDVRPSGTATIGLQRAIEGTRWKVGRVEVLGENHATYYHTTAREAIQQCVETWGGELETEIVVQGSRIVERRLNLLQHIGSDNGKRFVYSKDISSIHRNIQSDNVITRLYGYGKGEEVGDGYGRRINFSEINDGKRYVEDPEATEIWGLPDGQGGKKPYEGQVIFEDCEDVNQLLELTKAELERVKVPKVSYEVSAIDLEALGFKHEGVDLGDVITAIDTTHNPKIRVRARVTGIHEDLLNADKVITIGNYIMDSSDTMLDVFGAVGDMKRRSSMWDVSSYTPSSYLQQIIDGLNAEFDLGGSYIYQSFEQGIIVSSVPLDEMGRPTRTPASAIQLKGGGFRIADNTTSDGEFDWRTFGTGEGFTADYITAGVIKGGSNWWSLDSGELYFAQGSISDAGGNSWDMNTGDLTFKHGRIQSDDGRNFWNLTTGEFSLQGQDLSVDGKQIDEYIKDNDSWSTENQKGVFDKLTNGGTVQGIYLSQNKVYINATYIATGTISDLRGYNYWNMETGEFSLRPGSTTVGGKTLDTYIKDTAPDGWNEATATQVFNKLTNNGRIPGITMQGNALYINATYINTGIFSVTTSGGQTIFSANKTANTVNIAGFTAYGGELRGEYVRLNINYMDIYSSINGSQIGRYGPAWLYDDANRRFVAMFSNQAGIALATGSTQAISGSNCKALYATSYGAWFSSGWNFWGAVDFHGATLSNCNIPSAASIAVADAIEDTIKFPVITKINSDGTIAEYVDGCELGFTNGILTSMTKPEEGA